MTTPSILSAVKKLRAILTREEKWRWLCISGFALGTSLFEVVTASVIVVFAQVLTQPEAGLKHLVKLGFSPDLAPGRVIFYVAIICGLVYLFKNLVAAGEVFFQNFAIQKMNYNFKSKLLHRYADVDYGHYMTRNSSLGLQVVGGDAENMFSVGMVSVASILSESVVFLCLVAMIVMMNPSLAIVIFGIAGVFGVLLTKWILPLFYRWGQKLQESAVYGGQNLLQFFHGFKEIILLGKRKAFIDSYQKHSYNKSRIQAIQTSTNAMPRMVIEVLFVGLFVVTILVLCYERETPTQMVGILGGYLYVGFRLMPGLNRMIGQLNTLKSNIPSIERVYNEYNTVAQKDNYVDEPGFKFNKEISIDDITFKYPNAAKCALENVSLKIQKGECIGIVGETGSGKSTLVDVLLGLLKPQSGSVKIDGLYPANSLQWHQKIGYVPQAIYLTDDTIAANIAFGENAEDIDHARLEQVIKDAQLQDFIKQLPGGVQTITGERGIRLSGGERQRIAIARALYRNPEVLIFDEATSALDNKTESKLMETIRQVSKNRTVIMVAHRLTTLKDCGRIVVMGNGKINEVVPYEGISINYTRG